MEVKVIIPPVIEAGKKTDIRDWCNRHVESGKSREEITAALIAMLEAAPVVLPGNGNLGGSLARGDDRESECFSVPAESTDGQRSADFPLLAALGLEVIGELENGMIEVYSEATRKFTTIRNVERMRYTNLVQIATRERVSKIIVREGMEVNQSGMYQMKAVTDEIADAAALSKRLNDETKRGAGCWEHEGDVVLVGDGSIARWNCKGILEQSFHPRLGNQLYNLTGNPSWFHFDQLSDAMIFVDPQSAVDKSLDVLRRWRWDFQYAPELVCGLIIATWIQKFWNWRPQVVMTGSTGSGKSVFFLALKRIFCGLGRKGSQSTTAIGISKQFRATSQIGILDELDKNKHRREIYEQVIRPAGWGDDERWTGQGKGVTEHALSQIFWLAGIESGIDTTTDADRVVRIEMLPRESKAKQIKQPSQGECEAIGQSLLAVAVKIAREAVQFASDLGASEIDGLSNRVCETYAVPAACWSLATGLPGEEWLRLFASNSEAITREVDSDEEELFNAILGSHVDAGIPMGRKSVRQLIRLVNEGTKIDAEDALEKVGIEYRGGNLIRLNTSSILRFLLIGTKLSQKSIGEIFSRMKNSELIRKNNIRYWEISLGNFFRDSEIEKKDDF